MSHEIRNTEQSPAEVLRGEIRSLVKQVLDGDESCVRLLIERFQGPVFGLCFRMLGNRQDAEDATQESFLRMYRSIARWDNTRDFRPWLLAIAGNRCRTMLAARKKAMVNVAIEDDRLEDESPPRERIENLQEEVDLALSQLRDEYKQAFLLFHEQELSYAEIADALDCPLGTVKTWVHRARREIASQLTRRDVVVSRNESSQDTAGKQEGQVGSSAQRPIFGMSVGIA